MFFLTQFEIFKALWWNIGRCCWNIIIILMRTCTCMQRLHLVSQGAEREVNFCLGGDCCKSSPKFLWVLKTVLQLVGPKYVLFIWRKESLGFILSIKIQYSYTDLKSFDSKWVELLYIMYCNFSKACSQVDQFSFGIWIPVCLSFQVAVACQL